jgi:hypothetical protein
MFASSCPQNAIQIDYREIGIFGNRQDADIDDQYKEKVSPFFTLNPRFVDFFFFFIQYIIV